MPTRLVHVKPHPEADLGNLDQVLPEPQPPITGTVRDRLACSLTCFRTLNGSDPCESRGERG